MPMNGPTPHGGASEDRLAFEFAAALAERDAAHQAETKRLLLTVADALDAFGRLLDGGAEAAAQDPEGFASSVRLAVGQLDRGVRAQGLEPLGALGESAEPDTHLVTDVRDEPGPEDSVVEVLQSGYRHRGRVLRPARVVVASGAVPTPPPEPGAGPAPVNPPAPVPADPTHQEPA